MIIILSLIVFVVGVAFAVRIKSFDGVKFLNFYPLKNQKEKLNLKQRLQELVKKKLNRRATINQYVSKQDFSSLNLVVAPVYVVDAKRLGQTHLKLFKRIFVDFDVKFNFVVLDGFIEIENKNINTVCLNKNKLNYNQIALLNILNVNKNENNKKMVKNSLKKVLFENKIKNYKNILQFSEINFDLNNNIFDIFFKTEGGYKLKLPNNCFNYFLEREKNGIAIYDIFHNSIIQIFNKNKIEIFDNVLLFETKEKEGFKIAVNFNQNEKDLLELLKFKIEYANLTDKFERLRTLAIKYIETNLFKSFEKIEPCKTKSLEDFFKVAFLRKNYFDDYLFLLKHIFNMKISNSILSVNPTDLVKQNFNISYEINNTRYVARYSFTKEDEVKLNRVGHKLGLQDNFVFGI